LSTFHLFTERPVVVRTERSIDASIGDTANTGVMARKRTNISLACMVVLGV